MSFLNLTSVVVEESNRKLITKGNHLFEIDSMNFKDYEWGVGMTIIFKCIQSDDIKNVGLLCRSFLCVSHTKKETQSIAIQSLIRIVHASGYANIDPKTKMLDKGFESQDDYFALCGMKLKCLIDHKLNTEYGTQETIKKYERCNEEDKQNYLKFLEKMEKENNQEVESISSDEDIPF